MNSKAMERCVFKFFIQFRKENVPCTYCDMQQDVLKDLQSHLSPSCESVMKEKKTLSIDGGKEEP